MLNRLQLRFSLKTLLIGMIIVSIPLAIFSFFAVKARRQAAAVATLQRRGATIYYDFQHYDENGGTLNRSRKPSDRRWARYVMGDDFFSDVYLVEFIEYRDINSHTLSGHINTFFGPVPTLTDVSRNADDFVPMLECLPNIRQLDLEYSEVSDASIPALAKLQTLEAMWIGNSHITEDGADRLGKLLPNCTIRWRPSSNPAADEN